MSFVRDVVEAAPADRLALVAIGRDGDRRELTFGEVADRSGRLAGTLAARGVERGDVVIFRYPRDESQYFIKRIIAVEGETVEVRSPSDVSQQVSDCTSCCSDCAVYVNGVKLDEPYIKDTPDYKRSPTLVPPGHVFVLGDNRRNSSDSHVRENGPLNVDQIIGIAFVSYWPQDRWGLIPHPTYAEIERPTAVPTPAILTP